MPTDRNEFSFPFFPLAVYHDPRRALPQTPCRPESIRQQPKYRGIQRDSRSKKGGKKNDSTNHRPTIITRTFLFSSLSAATHSSSSCFASRAPCQRQSWHIGDQSVAKSRARRAQHTLNGETFETSTHGLGIMKPSAERFVSFVGDRSYSRFRPGPPMERNGATGGKRNGDPRTEAEHSARETRDSQEQDTSGSDPCHESRERGTG